MTGVPRPAPATAGGAGSTDRDLDHIPVPGKKDSGPDPGGVRVAGMAEAVHPRDLLKPRMRGWLHAYAFVVSLVTGVVITLVAPAGERRLGAGIYALTVAMLFGTSALYHRITWQP